MYECSLTPASTMCCDDGMGEHEPQPAEAEGPRQQLIALLQSDFTPDEQPAPAPGNALGDLIAHAYSTEDLDARMVSEESMALGEMIKLLLEPAPTTESFKNCVAYEVRRAYAHQDKVSEVVAPERLGLLSGEGIFDPAQAKDLEAQTLVEYSFDFVKRYMIVAGPPRYPEPTIMQGPARPHEYREAVDYFVDWLEDYRQTYVEDPLAGTDYNAYIAAALTRFPMDQENVIEGLERQDFVRLLERVSRVRDEDQPGEDQEK